MTKAWKRIGCAAAIVVVALLVYTGFAFKRVVTQVLAAESRGNAYMVFFLVLEEHTAQTGELPGSIDEILRLDSAMTSGEYFWSTDSEYITGLVGPDFSVLPEIDNLSEFAPDYKQRAGWGDVHCEFYWQQVVENCGSKASP